MEVESPIKVFERLWSLLSIYYVCYTKYIKISLILLRGPTIMITLDKLETNRKMHVESIRYLVQVCISQESQKYFKNQLSIVLMRLSIFNHFKTIYALYYTLY